MRFTAVLLSIAALWLITSPMSSIREPIAKENPADWFPLTFHSEVIKLYVEEDSLTVDGLYRFVARPTELEYTGLFFPYPADSLLGVAHMVSVQARDPDKGWIDLIYKEAEIPPGSDWKVPLGLADTLEIRAIYRQHLQTCYARYIVTSTKAWNRPLRWARFEVHLPDGAEQLRFSYPFEFRENDGNPFYYYEAREFLPDRDIIVNWSCEPSVKAGESRE